MVGESFGFTLQVNTTTDQGFEDRDECWASIYISPAISEIIGKLGMQSSSYTFHFDGLAIYSYGLEFAFGYYVTCRYLGIGQVG